MTPARQHVLLVPGFFGFANVGDFAYFGHARDVLSDLFHRWRIPGEIRVVKTYPTASLWRRAVRVLETIAEVTDAADGAVHLIGHSSGGLDARLLLTPGIELKTSLPIERYASKVKTAVSLSSPHFGSPLASLLDTLFGQQLLRVFSLSTMYTLRTGKVPIAVILHLVRLLSLPQLSIAPGTLLNQIYRQLLKDFSAERRRAIEDLLQGVLEDQALLGEVTPAGMERFNAQVKDRPGVRYGSVVSCAPRPGLRTAWTSGLSPFRQSTHTLYGAFYRITARMQSAALPLLSRPQAEALRRAYGRLPDASDNDGMVPTLSQVWGQIIHAACADHLDVIGHFYLPTHAPPHFDWMNSGSRFQLADFERIWIDVVRFLLG